MNELDVIEVGILADLVANELERIEKDKTLNSHEKQLEFDLRMLLHKLSIAEKKKI